MHPFGAPLKIVKRDNIFPLAVLVATRVTQFVSIVDAHAWIFLVPFASSILLDVGMVGIGDGCLIHVEDVIPIPIGSPLLHHGDEDEVL